MGIPLLMALSLLSVCTCIFLKKSRIRAKKTINTDTVMYFGSNVLFLIYYTRQNTRNRKKKDTCKMILFFSENLHQKFIHNGRNIDEKVQYVQTAIAHIHHQ